MKLQVNGDTRDLSDGTTLAALIEAVVGATRGSAAIVDDEVVPRSRWPHYPLRDGQTVELITAVPGG
jgi:sulfur carrier protein